MDSATAIDTMRLRALWRYPVKSLQGEELREAVLEDNGLAATAAGAFGTRPRAGSSPGAASRSCSWRPRPSAMMTSPPSCCPPETAVAGRGPTPTPRLTDWLERPVTLVGAVGAPGGEAEFFADATDDTSRAIQWTMPPGRFVDAAPLLVLTTASLRAGASLHPEGAWEVRRFRPNLLVEADADGWVEDGWCGRTVNVGAAALVPQQPCIRCTMVTRPQPDLARDLDIYKSLARNHDGTLGVWTQVHAAGSVAVDDLVTIGS